MLHVNQLCLHMLLSLSLQRHQQLQKLQVVIILSREFSSLVDQSKQLSAFTCCIILGAKYESYTETLSRLELQILEDSRLHLCHQFAQKCLESEQYSEGFPLNPTRKTQSMRLRNTYKFHVRTKVQYQPVQGQCHPIPYRSSEPHITSLLFIHGQSFF